MGLNYRLNEYKVLYFTIIWSYITHGIEVWYRAPHYVSSKINTLQKMEIRTMNSLPYNAHAYN